MPLSSPILPYIGVHVSVVIFQKVCTRSTKWREQGERESGQRESGGEGEWGRGRVGEGEKKKEGGGASIFINVWLGNLKNLIFVAPEKLGKGTPEKKMGGEGGNDSFVVAVGDERTGNVLYVANLQSKHAFLQKLYRVEVHGILSAPEIIQYCFASSAVSHEMLDQCIASHARKDLDLVEQQLNCQLPRTSRAEIIRSYVRNNRDIVNCIMELVYALSLLLFFFCIHSLLLSLFSIRFLLSATFSGLHLLMLFLLPSILSFLSDCDIACSDN